MTVTHGVHRGWSHGVQPGSSAPRPQAQTAAISAHLYHERGCLHLLAPCSQPALRVCTACAQRVQVCDQVCRACDAVRSASLTFSAAHACAAHVHSRAGGTLRRPWKVHVRTSG
eukprot:2979676-Rhodomonas_salina.1